MRRGWFSRGRPVCPHGHVPVPAVCVVPAPPSSSQPCRAERCTHTYINTSISLIKVLDWFGPRCGAYDAFRAHARYAKVAGTYTRFTTLTRPSTRGHSRLIPALFSRDSLATNRDTLRICLIKGTKLCWNHGAKSGRLGKTRRANYNSFSKRGLFFMKTFIKFREI